MIILFPADNCIDNLKLRHMLTPVSRKVMSLKINITWIINQPAGRRKVIKLSARYNTGNTTEAIAKRKSPTANIIITAK